jgi:hypothetical protein
MTGDVVYKVWRHTDLVFNCRLRQPATHPTAPGQPIDLTGSTVSAPEVNGPLDVTVTMIDAAAGRFRVSAPYAADWITGRVMWFQVGFVMAGGGK